MTAVAGSPSAAKILDEGSKTGLRLLVLAHVFTDLNQGVLPVLIPFLIMQRGLSLAVAATLVLAANLLGSVVQLVFGHLSDRKSMAWVIPVSLLVATGGTALIGLAPNLPLMLAGAMLSGFGIAAFHPEGSRFSNYFAGRKRSAGMSFFTVGGFVGFAIGPLLATPLVLRFGLPGVVWLMLPAIVVAALIATKLPKFNEVRAHAHVAARTLTGENDARAFSIMSVVVALRSTTFLAAVNFTPIFALRVLGAHPFEQSVALFGLLAGGAVGTIAGGLLGERMDRRRVVTLSLLFTTLAGLAIAIAGATLHSILLMIVLAPLFGVALGLAAGVLVVLGQEYLPKNIGIASGVTLGLANTIGGIAAPIFGHIGDAFGMVNLFLTIALFALLGTGGSLLMPKPKSVRAKA
jgi:MFS transporter, FSR family, fosmidomycin resistance protein